MPPWKLPRNSRANFYTVPLSLVLLSDFKDLGAIIWDTAEEEDLDAYHLDLTWPRISPQCLLSFVAALGRLGYFHNTIERN